MMRRSDRFGFWRRQVGILQALLLVGIPFLRCNGESLLRFDIPSLSLLFFCRRIWIEEFFLFLIIVLFLTFLTLFLTLLLGRIWCGWLCPQTVLSDLTSVIDRLRRKGILFRVITRIGVALFASLVAADLIWYFVSPYDFFASLIENPGGLIMRIWIVLSLVIAANLLLLRRRFCATVCPYAKMQSVLFDSRTLVVAFDPAREKECLQCRSCVRNCPVQIDIREGLNVACIHCATCIDSCAARVRRRGLKSLINYSFGLPGSRGGILRSGVVLTGSVTLFFAVLFLYLALNRAPIKMELRRDMTIPMIQSDSGELSVFYHVSLRNLAGKNISLRLKSSAGAIRPDHLIGLAPGMTAGKRIRLILPLPRRNGSPSKTNSGRPAESQAAHGPIGAGERRRIEISALLSGDFEKPLITVPVYIIMPERRGSAGGGVP